MNYDHDDSNNSVWYYACEIFTIDDVYSEFFDIVVVGFVFVFVLFFFMCVFCFVCFWFFCFDQLRTACFEYCRTSTIYKTTITITSYCSPICLIFCFYSNTVKILYHHFHLLLWASSKQQKTRFWQINAKI